MHNPPTLDHQTAPKRCGEGAVVGGDGENMATFFEWLPCLVLIWYARTPPCTSEPLHFLYKEPRRKRRSRRNPLIDHNQPMAAFQRASLGSLSA